MDTEERPSVCTLDCPDTCSLTVTVEAEHIVKVRGSEAMPFTGRRDLQQGGAGHGGVRARAAAAAASAAPHRTEGRGAFERISWDAALDEIHARTSAVIDRWGPQAVTPLNYAGPHGMLSGDSMSLRFFHKLGASLVYRRSLCGGVRSEAWAGTYGAVPGCPPEFAEHAALNVVWGNNATVANLHLVRARPAGDARRAASSSWSIRCAPRSPNRRICTWRLLPGTDTLLAWSLAAELERAGAFDTGVHRPSTCWGSTNSWRGRANGRPRAPPRHAACRRSKSSPWRAGWRRPIRWCWRRATAWNAAATAAAASARRSRCRRCSASWGKGSGITLGAGSAFPKTPARLQRPDLVPPGTRTLNLLDIGRHLESDDLDPPLRAVFIYNHNPIVVHPDQNRMRRGLAREDIFTVGIDVTMTESMAYCDIVLPAATSFECDDLYALLRPPLAATRRAGDRAARRIAAEHGNLPPAGGAVRVRRCRASRRAMPS